MKATSILNLGNLKVRKTKYEDWRCRCVKSFLLMGESYYLLPLILFLTPDYK